MNNGKTLLITGASGFVGTWLADAAAKAGYRLIGIDLRGPLKPELWSGFSTASCQTADLEELLHGQTLYAVYHLAGGASVAASTQDPYGDFSNLMPGTARIALYMTKYQPQARFFLFSSAAVYGNPQTLPITEDTAVKPISAYGIHKATAEVLLNHYSHAFGLPVTIFRIFSVYGPGLRKQLIWDVCRHTLLAREKGEKSIMLFGTGNESRDFIHVEDLCNAVLLVASHQSITKSDIYNVSSGVESTIAEVAQYLVKHLGADIELNFNGVVPKGDPANWRADISKIKNLGFSSSYSLNEGLQNVAKWAVDIY